MLMHYLQFLDTGQTQSLASQPALAVAFVLSHHLDDTPFVSSNYWPGFILKLFTLIAFTAAFGSQ